MNFNFLTIQIYELRQPNISDLIGLLNAHIFSFQRHPYLRDSNEQPEIINKA